MATRVGDIEPTLSSTDMEYIRVWYGIPKSTAHLLAGKFGRACSPPEKFITVYEIHLRNGLRIPLAPELHRILVALGVPIARFQPNAVRYLVSLCVFARHHNLELDVTAVKVIFRFHQGSDWIWISPLQEFNLSGGNPESTTKWKDRFFFLSMPPNWDISNDWGCVNESFTSDPTSDEIKSVEKLTTLVQAHAESFHLNKKNRWLTVEAFLHVKWEPNLGGSASSPLPKKKLKRKHKSPRINEAVEDASKSQMAAPESSSDDDNVVIEKLKKSKKSSKLVVSKPQSVSVSLLESHESSGLPTSGVCQSEGIVEAAVVEIADKNLPAGSEPEILGEKEAEIVMGESEDMTNTDISFESEMLTSVQTEEFNLLTEIRRFTPEVQTEKFNSERQEPEVHVPLSDESPLAELHELAGYITSTADHIAQSYVKREKLVVAEERLSKLENELSESKAKVSSLDNSLKDLQQSYLLLRDQNLKLEDELRTSVKADDIKHALNCKYWDGINLCKRIMKLIIPKFPLSVFHPRNASAMQRSEITGCPREEEDAAPSLPGTSGSPSRI